MTARLDHMPTTTAAPHARPAQSQEQEQYVTRFDRHQRIQHILMISTFLTLAFTGLPQKTAMFGASGWIITTLGGLEMVQLIHRVAAIAMLLDGVYHLGYLLYGVLIGKKLAPLQMIPMPKDIKDFFQMSLYFFGLVRERPRFGKYSYLEKFDYFAVFWGVPILGGTGLILMFPVQASKLFGGGIVPIALTAHSDEAVLAVGWIFIVHFFYVHLAPTVFPFNTSIFTGKVPVHRYSEEHPLDFERMQRRAAREQALVAAQAPTGGDGHAAADAGSALPVQSSPLSNGGPNGPDPTRNQEVVTPSSSEDAPQPESAPPAEHGTQTELVQSADDTATGQATMENKPEIGGAQPDAAPADQKTDDTGDPTTDRKDV